MSGLSKNIPAELPREEQLDVRQLYSGIRSGDIGLVCVLGPTASGKTAFAVALARLFSQLEGRSPAAEIISADSRQVYRGMTIGTGKDLSEYGEIPYHLIDILPPGSRFNVYEYRQLFERAYDEIRSRGNIPILCGGTGLYINAVTADYGFDGRTHPLSSPKPSASSMKTFFIGTLVDRETRNSRIDRRLDARLEEGLTDEVKALLDSGVPAPVLISYGLEYRFVTQYVLGQLGYGEMRNLLAIAIHQFAKRQMTWFRGMERSGVRIHWVNASRLPESVQAQTYEI